MHLQLKELTMSGNMLGVAFRDARGPLNTLLDRLAGQEGEMWLKRLNKFNRGENPFEPVLVTEPKDIPIPIPIPIPTLYLHEKQKTAPWISGYDLEAHLKKTGLIDRCFSLEDDLIKGWLANPSTYPEEFKGRWVNLWKSAQGRDGGRNVPCLSWDGGKVIVHWPWLSRDWGIHGPALLASA